MATPPQCSVCLWLLHSLCIPRWKVRNRLGLPLALLKLQTFQRNSYRSPTLPLWSGRRFRFVVPSSLWHPGAFARSSIPAPSHAYANPTEKRALVEFGRQFGTSLSLLSLHFLLASLSDSCGSNQRWVELREDTIQPTMASLLGCHSCGTRRATSYIGDHMPPNSLCRSGQKQRFYPHCASPARTRVTHTVFCYF